nr:DNA cytosine methyltransferase [Burkholderia gladioli]
MLGEGFRAALRLFGIGYRAVCYVEREAGAAAQIAALMESGALDPALVWSDLLTFDGAPWRGRVDCVVAGFPCQDLSVAGRRAGLDGKRSGLFFNVVDVAEACGAWLLVLENVGGIVSATASVMDEEGTDLLERAASRVLGELADRGWNAEWIHLRASDVGASHQRERWFCIAWRAPEDRSMGDAGLQHEQLQQWGVRTEHSSAGDHMGDAGCRCSGADQSQRVAERVDAAHAGIGREVLGDAGSDGRLKGRPEPGRLEGRSDSRRSSGAVVNADCSQRRPDCVVGSDGSARQDGNGKATGESRFGNEALGDAARINGDQRQRFGDRAAPGERPESRPEGSGEVMADSDSMQREQHSGRWTGSGCASAERSCHQPAGRGTWDGEIFAPGPLDDRWPGIVADRPDLAPAVEPGIRMLVDGMAYLVDESRNHQLRQIGNGVVPLQAAVAFVELLRRAGALVK